MALPRNRYTGQSPQEPAQHDDFEDAKSGPEPLTFDHVPASQEDMSTSKTQHEHNERRGENEDQGWNTDATAAQTWHVFDSLTNQHAWALIRRFNNQVFCVRSIDDRPLTTLDMNAAPVEEVSPERIRAHMERFYMTVFVGVYSFYKHIVRLRSWREKPRTLSFLAVYTLAWHAEMLLPTLLLFLMILILYPRARKTCFPPAPPSLIDSKTGGVKSPKSGQLASNSVTGAPENHPGEATEQEAHNFMKSLTKLLMTITAGQHPRGDDHENGKDDALNPSSVVEGITDARDRTEGVSTATEEDKTKRPVSDAVEKVEVHPAMQILPELVDEWERFDNALNPMAPFPLYRPRLVLAACLLPPLILFWAVPWQNIMQGVGFVNGFVFFGDPVIQSGKEVLNRKFPRWRAYLEPRHTILRGVPTNAQLAITILRIEEARQHPLPPPPSSRQPASAESTVDKEELDNIGASHHEIQDAVNPEDTAETESQKSTYTGKSKTVRRMADAIKRATKGGAKVVLKIDHVRARIGEERATERLGAVEVPGKIEDAGPTRFPARYHGEKGYAYITTKATSPAISWKPATEELGSAWTVPLPDIRELRKIGGLGWKSKAVVGGVLGWQVADGLIITTGGNEYHLTAITRRDELFNRLISIRGHMWEML